MDAFVFPLITPVVLRVSSEGRAGEILQFTSSTSLFKYNLSITVYPSTSTLVTTSPSLFSIHTRVGGFTSSIYHF